MTEATPPNNPNFDAPRPLADAYPAEYAEDLFHSELADEILNEHGFYHFDDATQDDVRRDHWISKNNMFTFDLTEKINDEGRPYYLLDVVEIGVAGEKHYAFVGDRAIYYVHDNADESEQVPSHSRLMHEVIGYLRGRYGTTMRGKEATRRYEQVFDDMTGRLSVETALASPTATMARAEAQARNPVVKARGVAKLLAIAEQSHFFKDEAAFMTALPKVIQEQNDTRWARQHTADDTAPLPVVPHDPDAPAL